MRNFASKTVMYMTKLSSIADYVTDKISSNDIALREYVTTDCILQNKKGREIATNLPPQSCCLTRYQRGDVLIANIRPYLKKVWFADIDGGASSDVLVFRAKEGHSPSFLYAVLLQDSFFDYVMQGAKGSKMPRGDKEQILRYEMPTLSCSEESIGTFFLNLDKKIRLNEQINQNLEAMAKQLYDYWFVQFDFPNEDGKPYKSSGGAMVWNEKLKRDIPASWKTKAIEDIADVYNGATPSTINEQNYGGDIVWITPKDLSDQKQKFVYQGERNISQAGYNSCSTHLLPPNTILMSSRAPIGLLSIAKTELCTNQGFKSFVPKAENISTYLYYYLNIHIKQIEQLGTGTTFKEVSREDVLKFPILKPSDAILDLWEKQVSALNNKQFVIQKENEFLTKQRDELLPLLMNGQVSVNSDLSVYKKKRRGRIPSLTLNQVSDIQILHRQSIVLLTKQVLMDELQSERLIILVIIPFGTEIFVPIAWHVLLEETSQVFQAFGLVLLEVAAHDDDAPVGEVASSVAVLPEADVAVQITLTDVHAKAVGILHHATTVSVAELLTQVEIEIKNQIFLFHN